MKAIFTLLTAWFLFAFSINAQIEDAYYEDAKKALAERPYPQWFKDAKLGIFIHWGIYSVPSYSSKEGYAEWFLRGMQMKSPQRMEFVEKNYGSNFTYKDFAPLFKAELFDPDEWASLFERAGAKYVVLVSKHHDGYTLWPSKYNRNWNSVDIGPKRDIVGELTEAVRKTDLKMGLYYSLSEWNHPLHRWYTDPHDSIGKYVDEYMIPQFKELVGTYKPKVIFSDGEWYNTAKQWHAPQLINWYYNLVGNEAIVNNRWGHGLDTGFLTPEYSSGIKVTDRPWAEVRGLGRSFGLNRNEDLEAYGTSKELIARFVQTVANGGGMILNVGPKADGQIPMIQQERLVQLGDWLKTNGAAMYGAEPYEIKELERSVSKVRTDENINFNWVRNSPMKGIKEDDFTVNWQGYISVPKSGKYTFMAEADDAVNVEIDGKKIIDLNYTAQGTQSEVMDAKTTAKEQGQIKLKAGEAYPISVNYQEKKQNASVRLYYSLNGEEKEIVPASYFFTDKEKTAQGLKGTYRSLETYMVFTKNYGNVYAIAFDWPEKTLKIEMPSLKTVSAVKLLGLDRILPFTYDNGILEVDTSGVTFAELPSYDVWTFEIKQ